MNHLSLTGLGTKTENIFISRTLAICLDTLTTKTEYYIMAKAAIRYTKISAGMKFFNRNMYA